MTSVRLSHEVMQFIDSLDVPGLEAIQNACSVRLLEMRRTDLPLSQLLELLAEIKANLEDQRKHYHGLDSWQWMDGCMKFWLNPVEQDIYQSGWFSIDELRLWLKDQGPVMIEEEDEGEPDLHAEIRWLPRNHEEPILV
ncbi:MAG: hypothetical protein RI947_1079 [Candidatus Parcubacteria bacterium]|jgi:hypothetical protein